ncbi:heterokaryon incompatibility protein-domain-containing protein [Hyaloscypha finlandica]|nr:heterokaryon incompatibility protein-domain-containing protein [Hyaloscypha sp. PMI_1271]KAH8753419.1 heterokaryon incompatibility protein-domain-containing protein [Hyaloscypha finlandica]
MRLINTSTLRFEQFLGTKKPPYAILSHTWGNQEVTYDETLNPSQETRRKAGFQKIESCCGIAREHGLSYVWVDTCCIDKRSSAELSEAINSMYRWYRDAEVCFAYIVDVDSVPIGGETYSSADQIQAFKKSRWFSRGWTLQELIAPRKRAFFSNDWSLIHFSIDKTEKDSLDELLASITGVSPDVFQHREPLSKLCVAERMSWASRRETTREEDMAYCLMGILNVNMPILYGEGSRKAFRRLQEEIMKNSFDYSLFAWPSRYAESGLLAQSPTDFANIPKLGLWSPSMLAPFQMTNLGLLIRLNFNHREHQETDFGTPPQFTRAALQVDVKSEYGWGILVVRLRPVMGAYCVVNDRRCRAFRRVGCSTFEAADNDTFIGTPYEDILVLEDEHLELVQTAQEHHNERWGPETRFMLGEPLYSEH